jgi:hypothetical protein
MLLVIGPIEIEKKDHLEASQPENAFVIVAKYQLFILP